MKLKTFRPVPRISPRLAPRFALACAVLAATAAAVAGQPARITPVAPAERVLLISIDGMHEQDLARYVASHPTSALAALAQHGVMYRNARTPVPSDSFPGMVALISGASPVTSGVYYDDSFDRRLSPAGAACIDEKHAKASLGAEVVFDESIDRDPKRIDGGGAIDAARLPRDPARHCAPVYPHNYLRVNTVFDVVRAAGGRTAWADKHLAYDFVHGPSGRGVDDLYTPEIAAVGEKITSFPAYDNLKVDALLRQIDGRDSGGNATPGVPRLFGMNFQQLSVAQKSGDGYLDAHAKPGVAIATALDQIDGSLRRVLDALVARGLDTTTLVVIAAKHGQSPVAPGQLRRIDGKHVLDVVARSAPDALAKATLDDVGLLWLKQPRATQAVVNALRANADALGIEHVYAGNDMPPGWGRVGRDSHVPDIAIETQYGVIYTRGSKVAEHGGFHDDDRHVALLISRPDIAAQEIDSPVSTRQVAPTLLQALALKPTALDAVRSEGTASLPGLNFHKPTN
ncbi:type I phosphodiesterase/nucleotide pyrophosphatase [Pandoraea pneumonica]|uniref:Type I phosphodiesterase/nucleotide pyrophosphatase n=1 Tax=Pandoraea pneumonica TaxID=2508299 RepID=A0A5E4SIE5_9BURK|nr:alkaline phosphatase family protein [Pandoraea pneumonica]VVD75055.1 type I phosphodiesterase/nucleotide pyrophosphatase [Pandoraea pneumonica]